MDLDTINLFTDQKNQKTEGLKEGLKKAIETFQNNPEGMNLMIENMIKDRVEEKDLRTESQSQIKDLITQLEKDSGSDTRIAEKAMGLLSDQLKSQQRMIEKLMEMLIDVRSTPESESPLDLATLQTLIQSVVGNKGEEQ